MVKRRNRDKQASKNAEEYIEDEADKESKEIEKTVGVQQKKHSEESKVKED